MALPGERALAAFAAWARAIEDGKMLGLEARRAFERHRSADILVRGFDLGLREADCGSRSKPGAFIASGVSFRLALQKSSPSVHLLNTNLMSKALARPASTLAIFSGVKPFARKRLMIDVRRIGERAAAHGVGDDGRNRVLAIAERPERLGDGAVDDLEIAAARELLELHEREIGLDAGRVAVHDKPDSARGRDHRDLRVAEAVGLAERDDLVPGLAGGGDKVFLRAHGILERNRRRRKQLVAVIPAIGRAPVVFHDAKHVACIRT